MSSQVFITVYKVIIGPCLQVFKVCSGECGGGNVYAWMERGGSGYTHSYRAAGRPPGNTNYLIVCISNALMFWNKSLAVCSKCPHFAITLIISYQLS